MHKHKTLIGPKRAYRHPDSVANSGPPAVYGTAHEPQDSWAGARKYQELFDAYISSQPGSKRAKRLLAKLMEEDTKQA